MAIFGCHTFLREQENYQCTLLFCFAPFARTCGTVVNEVIYSHTISHGRQPRHEPLPDLTRLSTERTTKMFDRQ